MKPTYYNILIGLLLFYIGWHVRGCAMPCQPLEVSQSDTVFSKERVEVYNEKPVAYKVIQYVGKTDTLKVVEFDHFKIDTLAILSDYLCNRYYRDSSISDSSCSVFWDAEVFGNELTRLSIQAQNNRPTTINHYSPPSKMSLYAGAYYNHGLGLSLSVNFKQWQFDAGAGLDKNVLVGVKYKVN